MEVRKDKGRLHANGREQQIYKGDKCYMSMREGESAFLDHGEATWADGLDCEGPEGMELFSKPLELTRHA